MYCSVYECVEVYIHFVIRLHGVVRNLGQRQLYLFIIFIDRSLVRNKYLLVGFLEFCCFSGELIYFPLCVGLLTVYGLLCNSSVDLAPNRAISTSHNSLCLIIRLTALPFTRLGAVLHVGCVHPYVCVFICSYYHLSRKHVRNHMLSCHNISLCL
jgi:hypothetical protein